MLRFLTRPRVKLLVRSDLRVLYPIYTRMASNAPTESAGTHKDPVTGEMISKSCVSTSMALLNEGFLSIRYFNFQRAEEAHKGEGKGCEKGRKGS